MQASVHLSNTIASDWKGLSWKGLLDTKQERALLSKQSALCESLFPESHHGADGPVQKHTNNYRLSHQRVGFGGTQGRCLQAELPSCPGGSEASLCFQGDASQRQPHRAILF